MDFHLDTLLNLPKLTVLTCSQQLDCILLKLLSLRVKTKAQESQALILRKIITILPGEPTQRVKAGYIT
jgi:hypothetical protein